MSEIPPVQPSSPYQPPGSTPLTVNTSPPRSPRTWPRAFTWGCGAAAGGCAAVIVALIVLFVVFGLVGLGLSRRTPSGPKVAVVEIEGLITASGGGAFGAAGVSSREIVEQIRGAVDNRQVKALLIRVNSPGGSAAASQEIFDEIRAARKKGKPVVVSMGDVAASGGYYVSCAADEIWANPATVTGSIGVIFTHADLSGLFQKIGYSAETLKTGEFKDLGAPNRPLTDTERAFVQKFLETIFHQFVAAVSEGRRMPKERVLDIAGQAQIFVGSEAAKLGLVDRIGNYHEALLSAARKGGIKGEPALLETKPSPLDRILGAVPGAKEAVFERLFYNELADRLAHGAVK